MDSSLGMQMRSQPWREGFLGEKKYDEIRRQVIALPKGIANDRMVDEVVKVLNRPLVRIAMRMP